MTDVTVVESINVTFDEKEVVGTSSHKPSDHATSPLPDASSSHQSDFITETLFPDALDLEEYENPNLRLLEYNLLWMSLLIHQFFQSGCDRKLFPAHC